MLCWFKQWRISSALDDGRDLPAGLRRHVGRCERCKAFLEGSRNLGIVLRHETETPAPPVQQVTPAPLWRRWAPAAAVIVVIVGLRVWQDSRTLPTSAPAPPPPRLAAPAIPLDEPPPPLPVPQDWASQSLAAIQEASSEPIRRELSGLLPDAEATVSTLVSYLPRFP